MRITILAAITAAALLPYQAVARGADQRAPARVYAPAGTSWQATDAPRASYDHRYEDRRDAPLYRDEGPYGESYYGDHGYGYGYPYGSGAYGVDDYAISDRFVRDDDGRLDYDRDYPYAVPYGSYGMGGGYYTIVETTTTTEPSVVRYAKARKVVSHRARRMVKARAYRASSRASGSKYMRISRSN